MAIAGALLIVIGVALLIPRGATPGATAHRNVPLGGGYVARTPGHRAEVSSKARRWRSIVAVVFIVVGLFVVALGAVTL